MRWRLTMFAAPAAVASCLMLWAVLACGGGSATAAAAGPVLDPRANPIPPSATGCYIGAYVGSSAASMTDFNARAGKRHALFLKFVGIGIDGWDVHGASSVSSFCANCYSLGAVPYLTIQPSNATSASLLTTADVAWVDDFASHVGSLNRPVFIRYGHEMNGNWYPWGWTHVTPDVYIAGFQQVAAIFRSRAPKAAMVWAPSQNWGNNCDHTYSNWYPGDAYVDWVGLTSYQWSYSGLGLHQFFYSIVNGEQPEPDFYQTFAVGHSKPMMIAETSCGDDDPLYYDTPTKTATYGTAVGQGAQNWWIPQVYSPTGAFSLGQEFPMIRAVTWFNQGDFDIGGSDPTQHSTGFSAYASAVSDPYWLSDPFPPTSVISGAASAWVGHDVTLTIDATDGPTGSGIASTYFAETGSSNLATQTYSAPFVVSAEGTTAVGYWSVDGAGNSEPPSSTTVRIDKSPPTSAAQGVPAGWVHGPDDVSIVASDGFSGVARVSFSLNGSTMATVTGPITVSKDGTTTIRYFSVDLVGNAEASHVATVLVDSTPPATTDDHVPEYALAAEIHLHAVDACSGVATTTWTLDGAGGSGSVVTTGATGSHTLEYASVDNVGNVETSHVVSFTVSRRTSTELQGHSNPSLAYGASVVLTGILAASGTPIEAQKVQLLSSTDGSRYAYAATSITGQAGHFAFRVSPSRKTWYRVAYLGTADYLPSTSARSICLTPRFALTSPAAASVASLGKAFTVYGYLKPRCSPGSYPVRIFEYRYVHGQWQLDGSVYARAYDHAAYTRYAAQVRLPHRGVWRLRAYASDSAHATTWSSGYAYVTVR